MKKFLFFTFLIFGFNILGNNKEVKFSKKKALTKAISHSENGIVNSVELDYVKNNPVWKIEIIHSHSKKEFKIDATNGKILSTKVDYEKIIQDTDKDILNINDIKIIVSKKTKHPVYTEIYLDKKLGKKIYEIQVLDGNNEISFTIDAHTGEILKFNK
ncbi:PepSY domain-containing protein [Streptobacillus moniliformis]|uniref:PepSY domain-containing protein n=1 Tax=Streptobacillus moniliformis TaxID=34105 RepID=UPI0007E369F5|nr:PepSY domain-containing protein [Streptobacillus moniliformis]